MVAAKCPTPFSNMEVPPTTRFVQHALFGKRLILGHFRLSSLHKHEHRIPGLELGTNLRLGYKLIFHFRLLSRLQFQTEGRRTQDVCAQYNESENTHMRNKIGTQIQAFFHLERESEVYRAELERASRGWPHSVDSLPGHVPCAQ